MFTGIITDIGTIDRVETSGRDGGGSAAGAGGDMRIVVCSSYDSAGIDLGASIACSGVCLTVVEKGAGWFALDVSGETIARTARDQWTVGRRLNLERAMKLGDELGGHIVTGHVDGIGMVEQVAEQGGSHHVRVRAEPALAPFMAAKGSVTVDGVSLTVNAVADDADGVVVDLNIIPHSWAVTTFGDLRVGQAVNLEIDVLARYLQRMEHYRGNT